MSGSTGKSLLICLTPGSWRVICLCYYCWMKKQFSEQSHRSSEAGSSPVLHSVFFLNWKSGYFKLLLNRWQWREMSKDMQQASPVCQTWTWGQCVTKTRLLTYILLCFHVCSSLESDTRATSFHFLVIVVPHVCVNNAWKNMAKITCLLSLGPLCFHTANNPLQSVMETRPDEPAKGPLGPNTHTQNPHPTHFCQSPVFHTSVSISDYLIKYKYV